MFKEKKKLLTKVESLNRKVQNLQAKLAAAKASNAVQQSAPQSQESPIVSGSNTDRTPTSIGLLNLVQELLPLRKPRLFRTNISCTFRAEHEHS
jgi:hypothetical protein